MDRIQHPSATPEHEFTEGNPSLAIPATTVTATWLNNVQEELVHLIEEGGLVPDETQPHQVRGALDVLYASASAFAALGATLAAALAALENADDELLATLAEQVDNEATLRLTGDSTLSTRIDNEQEAREAAVLALTAAIAARCPSFVATVPGASVTLEKFNNGADILLSDCDSPPLPARFRFGYESEPKRLTFDVQVSFLAQAGGGSNANPAIFRIPFSAIQGNIATALALWNTYTFGWAFLSVPSPSVSGMYPVEVGIDGTSLTVKLRKMDSSGALPWNQVVDAGLGSIYFNLSVLAP